MLNLPETDVGKYLPTVYNHLPDNLTLQDNLRKISDFEYSAEYALVDDVCICNQLRATINDFIINNYISKLVPYNSDKDRIWLYCPNHDLGLKQDVVKEA